MRQRPWWPLSPRSRPAARLRCDEGGDEIKGKMPARCSIMLPPRQGQTRCAHLTAWTRASNIAGMREGIPAALKRPGAGLVELESELEALLIEYDELDTVGVKGHHVLVRARAGRQAADMLVHIADLQRTIATMPARTLPEAAVQLRRLAALFEGWDNSLRRLLMPDNDDGETARYLLASALAAVETVEAGKG